MGPDSNRLWPLLGLLGLALGLVLSLPCSRPLLGGISEHMATHVLLQLIPGSVCHRAVHRDRADGSNSDDGGHRWGRPCVPGTGSGMMAREGVSLQALSAHWQ